MTRRGLIIGTASILMSADKAVSLSEAFDHLLLGTSDLEQGIAWFESRSGIQAIKGGVHPGRGTRNALASLGGAHYLEIIAPDPGQVGVTPQYPISSLAEPRLINFAVRTADIETTAGSLKKAGVLTSGIKDGSRRTVSGAVLRWKTLAVESKWTEGAINPMPFFIEWASDSVHPSSSAPTGCTIEELRFEHTRPDDFRAALRAIGLDAKVSKWDAVRIVATLQTPRGHLELK